MHFESNRLPLTSLLLERRGFLEVDVGDLELRRAAIACRLAVVVLSLGVWVGGPSRGLLDLRGVGAGPGGGVRRGRGAGAGAGAGAGCGLRRFLLLDARPLVCA